MYLYFELCAKIWGGSPATEQMSKGTYANKLVLFIILARFLSSDAGIETQKINETRSDKPEQARGRGADETQSQVDVQGRGNAQGRGDASEESDMPLSVPSSSTTESSTSSDGDSTVNGATEAVQIGRKRWQQFSDTLAGYKQEKMKKKLAADAQMVHFAKKELELKERMFQQLETTS